MKSVFLTFLIFAGTFLFAGSGVLSVIGEDWFHYASYIAFIVVLFAGIYVTLLRKPEIKEKNETVTNGADLQIEQKENENDPK